MGGDYHPAAHIVLTIPCPHCLISRRLAAMDYLVRNVPRLVVATYREPCISLPPSRPCAAALRPRGVAPGALQADRTGMFE